MDLVGVYTNKMATDAYRGAGRPEATYLIERLMDLIARNWVSTGSKMRLKNFPKPTEFPFNTAYAASPTTAAITRARSKKRKQLANWDELLKQRDSRARGRAACSASACPPTSRSARSDRRK